MVPSDSLTCLHLAPFEPSLLRSLSGLYKVGQEVIPSRAVVTLLNRSFGCLAVEVGLC